MKEISAADFKARCLALMDEVNVSGEAFLITKRGKAVAQLVPVKPKSKTFLNRLRGKVQVKGRITDPAIPAEDWNQE
jgi:prevent-host-death family protein